MIHHGYQDTGGCSRCGAKEFQVRYKSQISQMSVDQRGIPYEIMISHGVYREDVGDREYDEYNTRIYKILKKMEPEMLAWKNCDFGQYFSYITLQQYERYKVFRGWIGLYNHIKIFDYFQDS